MNLVTVGALYPENLTVMLLSMEDKWCMMSEWFCVYVSRWVIRKIIKCLGHFFFILTDFPPLIPTIWRDSVNGCAEGTSVCGCGGRNPEWSTGLRAKWWWISGSCQPLLVALLLLLRPVPSDRSSACWPRSVGSVWSGAGEEAADLPSQVRQALVMCVQ